ncbi:RHS repeat domain-containing protein [Rapidithrix thailandica]|uniref:RHS repeat domain-containing protein n=1 Tax=Rapidithrix thailandica TaxID=413964 RepID=A0AAW9S7N7_9BACT
MQIRPLFIFYLLLLYSLTVPSTLMKAQGTDFTPYIPLSPNAAEFNKYGTHPVSLVSGTPQINIPIYELKVGSINLPISLSYHASGVKVTQYASWVGLGWSLNAGGVISRTVRGMPDEEPFGWMNSSVTISELEQLYDWGQLNSYVNNLMDSHPDFFSYNLPTKSGKFIYGKGSGGFITVPYEAIEIIRKSENNTYLITDDEGTKYQFEQKGAFASDPDNSSMDIYVQSWYLTKMISADNTDSIQFVYETTSPPSSAEPGQLSDTFSRVYMDTIIDRDFRLSPDPIEKTTTPIYHQYVELKEIIFNQGKISFMANTLRKDYKGAALDTIIVYKKENTTYTPVKKFSFEYGYFSTPNPLNQFDYRLKLHSCSEESLTEESVKKTHRFEYNSMPLPSTNSYAQDYWGYYNGKDNGDLLPDVFPKVDGVGFFTTENVGSGDRTSSDTHIMVGMLEKIIYPTGGSSIFTFEPNKYESSITEPPRSFQVAFLSVYGIGKKQVSEETKRFTYPSKASPLSGTLRITFSPHTNPGAVIIDAQEVHLTDLTTGEKTIWTHTGDFTKELKLEVSYKFQPGRTYEITGMVEDDPATKIYIDIIGKMKNAQQFVTRSGGGIRVKEIANYNFDGKLSSKEVYQYNPLKNGVGKVVQNDNDFHNNFIRRTYFFRHIDCKKNPLPDDCSCLAQTDQIVYTSSSVYPQVSFKGADVLYDLVTKIEYDENNVPNGKTIYSFDTYTGVEKFYNPGVPGGWSILQDMTGRTGQLSSERAYKYNYKLDRFTLIKEAKYTYSKFNTGYEEGVNFWKKVKYAVDAPCVFHDPYGDFGRFTYHMKLGGWRNTKTTVKNYDADGTVNVTKTINTFQNHKHLQPTEIRFTNSTGDEVVTTNQYADDLSENELGRDLLKARNMQSQVLRQVKSINTKPMSKTEVFYGAPYDNTSTSEVEGAVVPLSVLQYPDGTSVSKQVDYQYNQQGKVVQVTQVLEKDAAGNIVKSGPYTTYIWGYGYTYPVFKIENARYVDILSELTANELSNLENAPTQTQVEIIHQKLKEVFPTAMVYGYTYEPLVGISSQIDPNGKTTHYKYDGLGRLEQIIDHENNVLQRNEYHYKGQ